MTKEVSYNKDIIKLKLYAANESECSFLKKLYNDLNIHAAACIEDKGNFHYAITIDLLKDE